MKTGAIFGLIGAVMALINTIIWIVKTILWWSIEDANYGWDYINNITAWLNNIQTFALYPLQNIFILIFFIMFLINIKKIIK